MKSVYDIQALETLCRDPHRRKLFCNAFFKKALPLDACLEKAPELSGKLTVQTLKRLERRDSQRDGATKLVFSCLGGTAASPSAGTGADAPPSGEKIEAVILRIGTGRTSLCVSSQTGCAAGCTFCATGRMGFVRNLTADELLDQVLIAMRLLREEGRTLRNIVFMGMGEPLHNEENLYAALDVLRDPRRFYFAESRLTVSTCGIPDAMLRFAERFPDAGLAVSLHSARQEVRERLMPIARRHPLPELRAALEAVGNRKRLMVEILLLKEINDGPDELAALMDFLGGTGAHINLIQFNPFPGAPFEPVSTEAREAFGAALRQAGFQVTLRYSLGGDIAAACGQLAGK